MPDLRFPSSRPSGELLDSGCVIVKTHLVNLELVITPEITSLFWESVVAVKPTEPIISLCNCYDSIASEKLSTPRNDTDSGRGLMHIQAD